MLCVADLHLLLLSGWRPVSDSLLLLVLWPLLFCLALSSSVIFLNSPPWHIYPKSSANPSYRFFGKYTRRSLPSILLSGIGLLSSSKSRSRSVSTLMMAAPSASSLLSICFRLSAIYSLQTEGNIIIQPIGYVNNLSLIIKHSFNSPLTPIPHFLGGSPLYPANTPLTELNQGISGWASCDVAHDPLESPHWVNWDLPDWCQLEFPSSASISETSRSVRLQPSP